MQAYFNSFPDAPRKAEIIAHLSHRRSALATVWEPDMLDEDEQETRIGLMCAVAKLFDCVLFSPMVLRASSGRTLLSSDGESDLEAELPPRH